MTKSLYLAATLLLTAWTSSATRGVFRRAALNAAVTGSLDDGLSSVVPSADVDDDDKRPTGSALPAGRDDDTLPPSTPGDGDGCSGGPSSIQVCGLCGILSDSSYPVGAQLL